MVKVLIVGDSISMGYTPAVAQALKGLAEVKHNEGNGGDSANVLANIDRWLEEEKPEVVTLNCGLHDIKLNHKTRTHQVPLESYRKNIRTIVDKILARGCRLLFVSTTPVTEERHNRGRDFDRFNADVDARNTAAERLLRKGPVPVIPLYELAIGLGLETALSPDGVHFTAGAYEQLGEMIADAIREVLQ